MARNTAKKDTVVDHGIVGSQLVRLSDSSVRAQLEVTKRRIKSDPDFARNLLRDAGIVTAKGNLTKKSGG